MDLDANELSVRWNDVNGPTSGSEFYGTWTEDTNGPYGGPGDGPGQVPEPSTILLCALGLIAAGIFARGKRRRN